MAQTEVNAKSEMEAAERSLMGMMNKVRKAWLVIGRRGAEQTSGHEQWFKGCSTNCQATEP